MRQNIRKNPRCVAIVINVSSVHTNIRRSNGLVVWFVDVVLRANVNKAERNWWEPRNKVIVVCNAVVPSRLVRDKVTQLRPCNTRRTESIESDCISGVAHFSGGKVSDGTTQAMANSYYLVVGV